MQRLSWQAARAGTGGGQGKGQAGWADGCAKKTGRCEARLEREEESGGKRKYFKIFKLTQENEFKQSFEFKHSKQCTGMYAIGNSYISLLN
jgi:hypothetical protein